MLAKSKKIISFRGVTKGDVHDSKKFCPLLVKEAAQNHDIDTVYVDKAHDNNRRNFNLLDDLDIEPTINIRKNASIKTKKGCPLRRDEVFLINSRLGLKRRKKQIKDGGRRWIAEIVLFSSSIKRVLGEDLLSNKFKAQKVEAGLKVMLYNKFISI